MFHKAHGIMRKKLHKIKALEMQNNMPTLYILERDSSVVKSAKDASKVNLRSVLI